MILERYIGPEKERFSRREALKDYFLFWKLSTKE